MSLELCQKLLKKSFKISGKQRVNQNSEISKQLDDLSSHGDRDQGYQDDLALDLATPLPSNRSRLRNASRGTIASTPTLFPSPELDYPEHGLDPSLIWKLPQQQSRVMKKITLNGKEKQIKICSRTNEPSFSMGELN